MRLRNALLAPLAVLLLQPNLTLAASLPASAVLHPQASASWSNVRIRVEDLRPDDGVAAYWRMTPDADPGLRSYGFTQRLLVDDYLAHDETSRGSLSDLRLAWTLDAAFGLAQAQHLLGKGQVQAQARQGDTYSAVELELCNGCDYGPAFHRPWSLLEFSAHSRLIVEVDAEVSLLAQDNLGNAYDGALDEFALARVGLGAAFATGGSDATSLSLAFDAQATPGARVDRSSRRTLSVSLTNDGPQSRLAGIHVSARAEVLDASEHTVPEPPALALAAMTLLVAVGARPRTLQQQRQAARWLPIKDQA